MQITSITWMKVLSYCSRCAGQACNNTHLRVYLPPLNRWASTTEISTFACHSMTRITIMSFFFWYIFVFLMYLKVMNDDPIFDLLMGKICFIIWIIYIYCTIQFFIFSKNMKIVLMIFFLYQRGFTFYNGWIFY